MGGASVAKGGLISYSLNPKTSPRSTFESHRRPIAAHSLTLLPPVIASETITGTGGLFGQPMFGKWPMGNVWAMSNGQCYRQCPMGNV